MSPFSLCVIFFSFWTTQNVSSRFLFPSKACQRLYFFSSYSLRAITIVFHKSLLCCCRCYFVLFIYITVSFSSFGLLVTDTNTIFNYWFSNHNAWVFDVHRFIFCLFLWLRRYALHQKKKKKKKTSNKSCASQRT